MNDTLQTLIRAVLKIGAGWLLSRGFATDDQALQITGGVSALIAVIWGVVHRSSGSATPVKITQGPVLLLLAILGATCVTGCQTALNSNKIIAMKQRCFGLVVETASTDTQTPNVKLGFVSTVWQMIPTSTNSPVNAPPYMDTFDLGQGLNPFSTAISENSGSGQVSLGTNGTASAYPPK